MEFEAWKIWKQKYDLKGIFEHFVSSKRFWSSKIFSKTNCNFRYNFSSILKYFQFVVDSVLFYYCVSVFKPCSISELDILFNLVWCGLNFSELTVVYANLLIFINQHFQPNIKEIKNPKTFIRFYFLKQSFGSFKKTVINLLVKIQNIAKFQVFKRNQNIIPITAAP